MKMNPNGKSPFKSTCVRLHWLTGFFLVLIIGCTQSYGGGVKWPKLPKQLGIHIPPPKDWRIHEPKDALNQIIKAATQVYHDGIKIENAAATLSGVLEGVRNGSISKEQVGEVLKNWQTEVNDAVSNQNQNIASVQAAVDQAKDDVTASDDSSLLPTLQKLGNSLEQNRKDTQDLLNKINDLSNFVTQ